MRDIYVDSEGGTLEIHLIGAKNLKAADRNGLSDPFCVTSLESLYTLHNREFIDERQSNTSPVCKKTLSPIWNQRFSFDVHDKERSFVEFRVYDWNKKSENDYLGYASFDCKLLTDFIEAEVNVELDTQGSIDVKLIYYPGKAYGRIMKYCIENNQNFKDTQFPPSITSICRSQNFLVERGIDPKEVCWMRPREYCVQAVNSFPQLFLDGIDPGDIRQQAVGDCYFLAALAVLALQPTMVMNIISPSTYNDFGVYQVKFFWKGKWENVVCDDYIPLRIADKSSKDINTLFARSASIKEIWVSIIEKAYAKLHGSYENIEGAHSISEALEHLTGGFSEVFTIGTPENKNLYKQMLKWRKHGHLMVCSTAPHDEIDLDKDHEANEYGIIHRHAYSILDVKQVGELHFIKLRNTWGNSEWLGRFSDQDSESWTDALKKKLHFVDIDDGIFFMEYSDFIKQFNYLYLCRIPMDKFISPSIKGEWDRNEHTCGGMFRDENRDAFCRNPQFYLCIVGDRNIQYVESDIRLIVSITLCDAPTSLDSIKEKNPICLYVVKPKKPMNGNPKPILRYNDLIIVSTSLCKQTYRDCIELLVPRPQDGAVDEYVIIATTFYPNRPNTFFVKCYSDWEKTKFVYLDRKKAYSISKIAGEWDGKAFYGPHYERTTFETNPKYLLKLKKTTDELPEEAPLSISCKVQDSKLPFFPYLISLPQYKKYKTSNDNTTPLAAKNCMVFPDANNTFYCIEEVFTCILKKKQKSWILIMSTPFQAVSKFNIELTSGYPLEVNYLE